VSRFAVTCGDHAAPGDPDEEWVVEGFATAAAARDYAARFVRAQIEDLRAEAASPEALREAYYRWGEYALAEGFEAEAWVAHCIATPATRKAETDYAALAPR
jgi:hypothetical protein